MDAQTVIFVLIANMLKDEYEAVIRRNRRIIVQRHTIRLNDLYKKNNVYIDVEVFDRNGDREIVSLKFRACYKKFLYFPGRGDECFASDTSEEIIRGDIRIELDYEQETISYVIPKTRKHGRGKEEVVIRVFDVFSNYDLSIDININLYEYLFGREYFIDYFGELLHVNYPGQQKAMVFEKYGLSSLKKKHEGDLTLYFNLNLNTIKNERCTLQDQQRMQELFDIESKDYLF